MTRPRLQVILSAEEDRTLLELRTATSVSQRTKDRAEVLRLSIEDGQLGRLLSILTGE